MWENLGEWVGRDPWSEVRLWRSGGLKICSISHMQCPSILLWKLKGLACLLAPWWVTIRGARSLQKAALVLFKCSWLKGQCAVPSSVEWGLRSGRFWWFSHSADLHWTPGLLNRRQICKTAPARHQPLPRLPGYLILSNTVTWWYNRNVNYKMNPDHWMKQQSIYNFAFVLKRFWRL